MSLLHNGLATLPMSRRFRGFLPVVIDVEMGGVDPSTHALLELAAVFLELNAKQRLVPADEIHFHITPAKNTKLDKASLDFIKVDPYNPFRFAVEEESAITDFFQTVARKNSEQNCSRAIVVGHNSWFDLHAIRAAAGRSRITQMPFHGFSSIDTATLGALLNGQTVLARICAEWGIDYDPEQAHSAMYDAKITAQLFCDMVNSYHDLK